MKKTNTANDKNNDKTNGKNNTPNDNKGDLLRYEEIATLHVNYPELSEIYNKLRECHEKAKVRREPPCMLVLGEQGVGKTTLYEFYSDNFPRVETEEGTVVTCLTASIPVPATVKGVATSLLEAIGDPEPARGSIVAQTSRLRQLLRECGTEIIFLDEFQHVIDRDSERVLKTTADWLKNMINQTKIPIVLLGMPSCVVILESNLQLKRRFKVRRQLKPFEWARPGADGRDEYPLRKLLRVIENNLSLKKASNLSDPETAYRIYAATNGIIDSIMKIVRGAADRAIETGEERITMQLLAEAYDDELADNQPEIDNPFVVTFDELPPSRNPAAITEHLNPIIKRKRRTK